MAICNSGASRKFALSKACCVASSAEYRLTEKFEKSEASWSRLRAEIAQLFVVRRESTPSPQPERRLDRARLFLQSGRVEAAVAEVRRLPGAANADGWIRDAKRYAAAQNALDLIETAAVLEPRKLRDGTGRAIEQASPADPVPGITQPAATEASGAQ